MPLEVTGKGPKDDGLTNRGVGGVQMAEVAVDTETGVVRIKKFVAVQDCGMILDLMTAESQVSAAMIMGIAYSLTEERIMDNTTGRYINADLSNYKLPRIGDIGEIGRRDVPTRQRVQPRRDRPGRAAGDCRRGRRFPTRWPMPSACAFPCCR